jgi:hypothetical protein
MSVRREKNETKHDNEDCRVCGSSGHGKRNPFSEPECDHVRSMASWNCLLAWLKMHGGDMKDVIWK